MHFVEKIGLSIAAIGFYGGIVNDSGAGLFILAVGLAIFSGYRKVN